MKTANKIMMPNGELIALSGATFEMFDTILKDHILTYEQTKGWALQGTYVYKEAVAGSRYGYPDFYAKCVEEFENSEYKMVDFVQPILSSNGTLGGNGFAVSASNEHVAEGYTYSAFYCFSGNANTAEKQSWQTTALPASFTIYNPKALNITNIQITNRVSYPRAIASGTVLGSNNNDNWDEITSFTNTNNTASAIWSIDLSTNTKSYKYYKLDNLVGIDAGYVGIGKINITATYRDVISTNPNGHLFYDIADKSQIDELYNTNGIAWYYGIDKENERIFLPRTKHFAFTGGVVGNGMTLGFTDGNANYGLRGTPNLGVISAQALFGTNISDNREVGAEGAESLGITTDPTKSGITLETDDSKYLYICVGNTNVESAVTDVVDVTTTENDTIPLGYSTYQNGTQPNVSWLKSQGQWNDGNVYTTFYNEFVQKIGQSFASGYVKEITDEYDDYDLVINQDDMTFRLPLLDGSESVVSDRYIDLTLGASGDTYIAPANGWFYFAKATLKIDSYVFLGNNTTGVEAISRSSIDKDIARVNLEVKAGDEIRILYDATGDTKAFKFVYAQGNGSLYFKVANAVQNLELLDAGEVLEALTDKVDINASNFTTEGKSLISAFGMPSSKYIDLTLGASGTYYTAPANGWITIRKFSNGANQYLACGSGINALTSKSINPTGNQTLDVNMPVAKGERFWVSYSVGGATEYFRFIYAQGEV